jgi:hypothetical protein
MSTKSREPIYGASIRHSAERAAAARKEAEPPAQLSANLYNATFRHLTVVGACATLDATRSVFSRLLRVIFLALSGLDHRRDLLYGRYKHNKVR